MNKPTKQQFDDVPNCIRQAFSTRPFVNLPELSEMLQMDVKTLRKHISGGSLTFRTKGTGLVHRHRIFSFQDVANFLERLNNPILPLSENRIRVPRRRVSVGSATRAKRLYL